MPLLATAEPPWRTTHRLTTGLPVVTHSWQDPRMAGTIEPGNTWLPDPRSLEGLTVAAIAVDRSSRLVYRNPAAAILFGLADDALVDHGAWATLFEEPERGAADEILTKVLSGDSWAGELRMLAVDGRSQIRATSWSPIHTAQGVAGALVLIEDPARDGAQARRLATRLQKLAAVTTTLILAENVAAVTKLVTEQLADAASATIGSLLLLDEAGTALLLQGIRGGRPGVETEWASFPVEDPTPAGESVRTGRIVVLADRAETERRYPGLQLAADGERALVCLPLRVAGRAIGVVTLSFPGRRTIDSAELEFLGILADVCAQTLDRLRAVAETEDREAKLRFLSEATAELVSDLDYQTTLRRVADLAVPWFADWCVIALAEDGRLRNLAVSHTDPSNQDLIEHLQERYPPKPEAVRGPYRVLRTGESDLIPEIADELLVAAAHDEEHLAILRRLSFRSAMSVALKVHDRVLGVITWVTGEGGRRFTEADLAFGEDLARRAAVAIDNAQLHSQLRDVALRLQKGVLPADLPAVLGWQAAVRYLPAGRTGAGGDFYDVIALEDGRLVIFVGDVMGRGVEATSTMGQVRSSVLTLVAVDPDPKAVMTGLDRVFEHLHVEQLVTVVYAVADPAGDTISVINAGHPSPLLIHGAGGAEYVPAPKTLILGAGGGDRTVVTRPFHAGDAMLLFTDGLVERRDEDLDASLSRLITTIDAVRGQDLAAGLSAVVAAVRDPSSDDDVAALVIRRD